ncbi:MAG: hypothetical protein ROO70_15475 [Labrenzia sp.]
MIDFNLKACARRAFQGACIAAVLAAGTLPSSAFDSHAGYYYPAPQTSEPYISNVETALDANKRSRAAFVIGLAAQQSKQAYTPGYHLFAKGAELEKLIIVATGDGQYDTLYRMRALLASLTSMARGTELFARTDQPQELNFLDFCKLIGFKQVTISNGKDITHQIKVN